MPHASTYNTFLRTFLFCLGYSETVYVMPKRRILYRSGHYDNGQGVSYAGSRLKSGYYNLKSHGVNVSTHRAIAWFWPRDGLRPVAPWMLDVDHVDKNYESIDYQQLQWTTRASHNRKHSTKKKNNSNSKPIRGRLLGESAWREFLSLSDAHRQTGCTLDGLSQCANGTYKTTSNHEGKWTWEWIPLPPDLPGERWRTCALPDGTTADHIEISDQGRVRKNGTLLTRGNLDESRVYHRLSIGGTLYLVSRVVASTWIRLPSDHEVADHINRNTHDNCASNLRWTTATENNENCVKPSHSDSIATRVQPFFDSDATLPAHSPFVSQTAAAAHYGFASSKTVGNALDRSLRTGGRSSDGRRMYWRRVVEDYGPGADLTSDIARHLSKPVGKERDRRLREEDARLGECVAQATAPESSAVMFEPTSSPGRLRFFAGDVLLGEADNVDPLRLAVRHSDGVWRVHTLSS